MSLSIAEHINKVLSSSEDLTKIVGDRLYPVSVKDNIECPFIVYERESVVPNRTKDGAEGDTVTENVFIFAENYGQAVNIAEIVRAALDGSEGNYSNFTIDECDYTDAAETYEDGVYIQQLVFNITTY